MSDELPAPAPAVAVGAVSLEELFSRDPHNMTSDDVEKIVTALRAQRRNFLIEEAATAAKDKKPKARMDPKTALAASAPKIPANQLSLASLGLGEGVTITLKAKK